MNARACPARTWLLVAIGVTVMLAHVCVLPGSADADVLSAAAHDHFRATPGDGVHAASCEVIRSSVQALQPSGPAVTAAEAVFGRLGRTDRGYDVAVPPPRVPPPLFLLHGTLLI